MPGKDSSGQATGTGERFGAAVVTVAGVAALAATLLTCLSVWLQTKNYRKPLLQRYVIRILLMVPIYSAASWASLTSLQVAFWIDPFRDVYEAFTIYTFLQLLINFIGGERALIVLMHGRAPKSHLWPLNHCLPKVDISDPHTFLAIKRGILQYTWLKPILALATIIMKATGTYQEGYAGLKSGYFWSGVIYNISITVCLYALAMFWGIIFASYWQGFFLSILTWAGAIRDSKEVPEYSADNIAAAIQDALICFEMPCFAVAHWYAFSWHDYADETISAARLPVKFALRDAFGPRDLIEDTKETFAGKKYEYRYFDAHDDVLGHEESGSRTARMMEGMRYERGGKGKYWIPKPGDDSRNPLLPKVSSSRARTMSPSAHRALDVGKYGATDDEEVSLNPEEEQLYANARALEFGDWNYPVITAHTAQRHNVHSSPNIITVSTNRNVLQPTQENRVRRKKDIRKIQQSAGKGKHRTSSSGSESSGKKSSIPFVGNLLQRQSSSSSSAKSDRSQLVDLIVEDRDAEAVERVRARKEGGPAWNEAEPKHFVRAYPDSGEEEAVREGYEPGEEGGGQSGEVQDVFAVGGEGDSEESISDKGKQAAGEAVEWQKRTYSHEEEEGGSHNNAQFESFHEERDAWGSDADR